MVSMVPQNLKAWRKEHGFTQTELARALGVYPLTISKWEMGIRKIPPFLHLALEALEARGGEKTPRDTKTKKEDKPHGKR